jgi:hypothetical protein
LAFGALNLSRPKNIIYFGLREYKGILEKDPKVTYPSTELEKMVRALESNTNLDKEEKV